MTSIRPFGPAIPVLLLAAVVAIAPPGASATRAEPPAAIATIAMIGEVAAGIAGSCAGVTTMMGPGIDPHLYQPSAGDVRDMVAADLLLYSGHNLEGQLGEVLSRLEGRKPAIAVAERAVGDEELIRPEGTDYADPHLWMDAALWSRTAPVLGEVLTALAPDCEIEIAERGGQAEVEMAALDAWIREAVATIPEETRMLVTAHDAFAYYGRAYGLEVVGIQGISTDSEAGIGDIRATVDIVIEAGVPAIFVESTISPRTVEAVVAAARERGHTLTVGPELYSDAMGEAGTAEGTYIGMLHANTRAIVGALGGTLPPLPETLSDWAERWKIGS